MKPSVYQRLMRNAPDLAPATADQLKAYRAHHGLTQRAVASLLDKGERSVKIHESDPSRPMPGAEWLLLRLLGGEVTQAQARAEAGFPTRQKRRKSPP